MRTTFWALSFAIFVLTNSSFLAASSAARTLHQAQPRDAQIIGPNGTVILAYHEAGAITVKECARHSVLQKKEDCVSPKGAKSVTLPIAKFADSLRWVLKLQRGQFSAPLKIQIELYSTGKIGDVAALERDLTETQAKLAQVEAFIQQYGPDNANLAEKTALEQSIIRLQQLLKIRSNSQLEQIIRELNERIDRLIQDVLTSPQIFTFTHAQNKTEFEYNVLKSFIELEGLNADFVWLPAAKFTMGSPKNEERRKQDETLRSVTLTKGFAIQTTEVTQLQYYKVMGANPAMFTSAVYCGDQFISVNGTTMCANFPVENVSWTDAQKFIAKLNAMNDGYFYRLPTAAEWEYAARSGSRTAYHFGDDAKALSEYSWHFGNGPGRSMPVARKKANAFGLYDMEGNVAEWVHDIYGLYDSKSVVDPIGAKSGKYREIRGGAATSWFPYQRSASRIPAEPDLKAKEIGFRLVRSRR